MCSRRNALACHHMESGPVYAAPDPGPASLGRAGAQRRAACAQGESRAASGGWWGAAVRNVALLGRSRGPGRGSRLIRVWLPAAAAGRSRLAVVDQLLELNIRCLSREYLSSWRRWHIHATLYEYKS